MDLNLRLWRQLPLAASERFNMSSVRGLRLPYQLPMGFKGYALEIDDTPTTQL